jgi:hypothetical protein
VSRDDRIIMAIAASALLTAILFAVDTDSGVRAFVVIAFLLIGPGLAIVRLLQIRDSMTEAILAVAASLGLETVVATALLATGYWAPGVALGIVVVVTLVFVGAQAIDSRELWPRRDAARLGASRPAVQAQAGPEGSE